MVTCKLNTGLMDLSVGQLSLIADDVMISFRDNTFTIGGSITDAAMLLFNNSSHEAKLIKMHPLNDDNFSLNYNNTILINHPFEIKWISKEEPPADWELLEKEFNRISELLAFI